MKTGLGCFAHKDLKQGTLNFWVKIWSAIATYASWTQKWLVPTKLQDMALYKVNLFHFLMKYFIDHLLRKHIFIWS